MPLTPRFLAGATCILALWLAPAAEAQTPTLFGEVGLNDAFTITLEDASGNAITSLAPGRYTIQVKDLSPIHNFHLTGPGVDMRTPVDARGTYVWTVTLAEGSYRFQCDPHPTMEGEFTVATRSAELAVTAAGAGSGSVTSIPAGISCGATCSATFPEHATVTLRARAAPGSVFRGWHGACAGRGPCVLTMDDAKAVAATFALGLPAAVARVAASRAAGVRRVAAMLRVYRATRVRALLLRRGKRLAAATARLRPGRRTLRLSVREAAPAGVCRLRLVLTEPSGRRSVLTRRVRLPP